MRGFERDGSGFITWRMAVQAGIKADDSIKNLSSAIFLCPKAKTTNGTADVPLFCSFQNRWHDDRWPFCSLHSSKPSVWRPMFSLRLRQNLRRLQLCSFLALLSALFHASHQTTKSDPSCHSVCLHVVISERGDREIV